MTTFVDMDIYLKERYRLKNRIDRKFLASKVTCNELSVNAVIRLMLNLSCCHANSSSAKLIFLWFMDTPSLLLMECAAPPGFGGLDTCIVMDGDEDIESRHITKETSWKENKYLILRRKFMRIETKIYGMGDVYVNFVLCN